MQISSESQFDNVYFLLGLLLKNGGLQKTLCWASVWDSGYQRMQIQHFGELQFCNASFLLGLLLKFTGLQKIILPGACSQDLVHAAWHNVPVYRLGPKTFKSEALPRKVADLKVFVSWGVFPTLFLRACSGCMAGARQEQCPCGPPGPKNL